MARLGRARVKRIENPTPLSQQSGVSLSSTSSLNAGGVHVAQSAVDLAQESSLAIPLTTRTAVATTVLSATSALVITGASGDAVSLIATTSLSTEPFVDTANGVTLVADSTLATDPSIGTAELSFLVAEATLNLTGTPTRPAGVALPATSALIILAKEAQTQLKANAFLNVNAIAPEHTPLVFFDLAASGSPPEGHLEPYPLTLGASWLPNDMRILFVAGKGINDGQDASLDMPMKPDPPTDYTSPYTLNKNEQTFGTYYRRLAPGSLDTSVAWPKPPSWRYFAWATLTARGVDPNVAPIAGKLRVTYHIDNPTAAVSSVTVPGRGLMLLFLATFQDPEGNWPSWASSMGVPTGWRHVLATDKSGESYYPYDSNPGIMVVGRSFGSAGTTGVVSVPIGSGAPAFAGMYCFLRSAGDVSIPVGAA